MSKEEATHHDTTIIRVTIPILQETVIDLEYLGGTTSVVLSTEGDICGGFDKNRILLSIEINLDTVTLLRSMMSNARDVSRKVVERISRIYLMTTTTTTTSSYVSSS
jgi:hypothetical protein